MDEEVKIIGNKFIENKAPNGNGGAINIMGALHDINLIDNYFENNFAKNGGAINVANWPYILYALNNTFINNTATENGGAIYLNPGRNFGVTPSANLTNNTFIDNDAELNGNAIFNKNQRLYLKNNTMSADKAPIFNLGTIISPTTLRILNNETVDVLNGIDFNLTLELEDDKGNLIIGQNTTFVILGDSYVTNDTNIIGTYYTNYHTDLVDRITPVTGSALGVSDLTVLNGALRLLNINLTITKVSSKDIIKYGEIFNYTIKISNIGLDNVTGIVVKDYIPVGLDYVGFEGNGWSYVNGSWKYNNTLSSGKSIELVLLFKVNSNATGLINNTANVAINELPNGTNTTSNNSNVSKANTITTVDDVEGKLGNTVIINGTVTDEFGNNITGVVNLTLPDGSVVEVNVTNGKFSYSWLIPMNSTIGENNISADYEGDDLYNPSNGTGIVNITKINTITTVDDVEGKPGDTVLITGTVTDEFGNPIDGTVSLTLPDGTVVTVSVVDGLFEYEWTIPKDFEAGNYLITAIFEENDYYYSSNNQSNLHVTANPGPGPKPTPTPTPKPSDK
ncbi:Ig-like domain repeat protein, partial [Methanobrevibacter sp. OttesenSCG-928-I08]|nr:Ig-like domain repeat protein [Methanobrevibacter sp. OttesenSCG-928-I08]